MTADERGVLIVGNFLSKKNMAMGVCETLASLISETDWTVITTSEKIFPPLRLFDMVKTTWRTRRQYQVAQVDVFNDRAFIWAEAVAWTLRRARKPYLLTLRAGNMPGFAKEHPQRVARLLRTAYVVTTPSQYLAKELSFLGFDIRVIPNAIDLPVYNLRERKKAYPRIVWLRAFHRIYNPVLAVQVIDRLRHEWPDVHLTMVGPDKGDGTFAEFQRFVAENDLGAHVTCVCGVPKAEVPAWLNKGDIFLNTTNVDNTPVSVMEAMACGLCVVSTNVGGIPYLLEHETDALLVPPNDPDALADAVRRILTEPGLAAQLSRNARAKAEQFDWSRILPQWQALLESALL